MAQLTAGSLAVLVTGLQTASEWGVSSWLCLLDQVRPSRVPELETRAWGTGAAGKDSSLADSPTASCTCLGQNKAPAMMGNSVCHLD